MASPPTQNITLKRTQVLNRAPSKAAYSLEQLRRTRSLFQWGIRMKPTTPFTTKKITPVAPQHAAGIRSHMLHLLSGLIKPASPGEPLRSPSLTRQIRHLEHKRTESFVQWQRAQRLQWLDQYSSINNQLCYYHQRDRKITIRSFIRKDFTVVDIDYKITIQSAELKTRIANLSLADRIIAVTAQ
jgi:hypothetical protein